MVRDFTVQTRHSECVCLCDNEPSIRQVQQRAVRARLALGVTKPLQLTAMETHCAKTLCKGLEV